MALQIINTADMVKAFTKAFTSDDIESFLKLIAPECVWTIIATGETFRGLDEIKQLALRSVAGRDHPTGMGIKPTNIFTNAEGTKLCWEYIHTGVVTAQWPSSTQRPNPGTKIELPIVLIIVNVREYFDLRTVTEPNIKHLLYS